MKKVEITVNDDVEQDRIDEFTNAINAIATLLNITAVIIYNETEDEQA